MLRKLFKTILVLSLCVGISLPTNAAVSVSDGSAFVTKAEFAADLNNLSNRMAQLENSLDAKIDSLVSSYLTRNGIWNGAKQEIEDDASSSHIGIKGGINTGLWRLYSFAANNTANYSTKAGDTARYSLVLNNSSSTNGTLIDSLNKSGLVNITLDFKFSAIQDADVWSDAVNSKMLRVGVYTAGTTNALPGDQVFLSLAGSLTFKNDVGQTYYCDYRNIPSPVPSTIFAVFVPNIAVYFFASKGDKIQYVLDNYCKILNVGALYFPTDFDLYTDWGMFWRINEVVVY